MPPQYNLNIDLNVLNHLGLNLYSNVPAVLSELVANAWDADATRVGIFVKGQGNNKKIIVQDNGGGMDDTDLRKKFLTVGYKRRSKGNGDLTPGGRAVMGRKGIGKLSVFSIAGKVQLITKKEDHSPLAIELDVEKIQEAIRDKRPYHPPAISPLQVARSASPSIDGRLLQRPVGAGQSSRAAKVKSSGTALILSSLKKRVNASLDKYLRQRVARRFLHHFRRFPSIH